MAWIWAAAGGGGGEGGGFPARSAEQFVGAGPRGFNLEASMQLHGALCAEKVFFILTVQFDDIEYRLTGYTF